MGGSLGLQAIAVYAGGLSRVLHLVPLRAEDWGLLFLVAAPLVAVSELVKTLLWRRGANAVDEAVQPAAASGP